MRSREKISNSIPVLACDDDDNIILSEYLALQLEVLLDIRELLIENNSKLSHMDTQQQIRGFK